MKLPEGWSEAEVLRCAAEICASYSHYVSAGMNLKRAQDWDERQKLAASAAPDDQGEKEAGGDSKQ